jgi:hypothetical protein
METRDFILKISILCPALKSFQSKEAITIKSQLTNLRTSKVLVRAFKRISQENAVCFENQRERTM